jgi:large subunit ribosomal protein L25
MKVVTLKTEMRNGTGKSQARRARREGKVPAIVYGEGKSPETIALPHHEFRMAVDGGARVIDLDIAARGVERVLLSEVQYDALGMNVVHADFLRMDPEHELELHVPIDFEGTPKGLAEGGVLTILRDTLKVRCLPRDIPERFLLEVSGLGLNESVSAGKIELPAGVKLAQDPYDTIVTCAIPRVKVEEVPAAAAEAVTAEGAVAAEGASAAPAAEGAAPAAGAAGAKPGAAAAPAKGAAPAGADKGAKKEKK